MRSSSTLKPGLILLAAPVVGYLVALTIGPFITNLDSNGGWFVTIVLLALNLVFYAAYFGPFLMGLFFSPIALILVILGLRKGHDPLSPGWKLLGAGVLIAGAIFLYQFLSFQPEHERFGQVKMGQTKSQVEALIGSPHAIQDKPCKDAPKEICEQLTFGSRTSLLGNSSDRKLLVSFRNGKVSEPPIRK